MTLREAIGQYGGFEITTEGDRCVGMRARSADNICHSEWMQSLGLSVLEALLSLLPLASFF